MKNFRRYLTYILLIVIILIFFIIGLFNKELFNQIVDLTKTIWPAIIALMTFAGFAVGGVLKNKPKSFDAAFDDKYVQITVLIFFLFLLTVLVVTIMNIRTQTLQIPINSEPEGAEIWINDTIYKGTTPDTLHLEKNKKYPTKLSKPEYLNNEFTINTRNKSFEEFKHIKLQKVWDVEFIFNFDSTFLKINDEIFINEKYVKTSLTSNSYLLVYRYNGNFDSLDIKIASDTVILVPDDLK